MNGRLFYVVGPSGSGKDSLLDYARERVPAHVRFATRTVTRPASAGGERHVAVTAQEFEALLASGAFAMHWQANGHSYGVGREIADWLDEGRTVVVSGSRAYLPEARTGFPQMKVVSVTATYDVLRARLAARAREDAQAIEARLARAAAYRLPPGVADHEIANDADIAQAGSRLLGLIA
jgi:ribose 1,5-bisphosphokinase